MLIQNFLGSIVYQQNEECFSVLNIFISATFRNSYQQFFFKKVVHKSLKIPTENSVFSKVVRYWFIISAGNFTEQLFPGTPFSLEHLSCRTASELLNSKVYPECNRIKELHRLFSKKGSLSQKYKYFAPYCNTFIQRSWKLLELKKVKFVIIFSFLK